MPTLRGTRLGPYEIHEQLGAGGMGEVYRAIDTRLGREVALKILPAAAAHEPQRRARLLREAQLISALNHPHICALHDVGTADGVDYLVLELLKGSTLLQRLRKGAIPVGDVLHLGSQIAEGLAAAHRHGVVHRDLKPGNVMLTPVGVKLLDFGLAKPLAVQRSSTETLTGESPITAEGTLTGTLHYMAPEQVQCEPADARTDIFALGVVLHEMVTGTKAFDGKNHASVIAKIMDVDPPPVSALVPAAPTGLDYVVQRCLAKNPDERWQSAHDVHLQLDWLRSQMPGQTGRGALDARHRRAWLPWATAAAALLAAVALLVQLRMPDGAPAPSGPPLRFRVAVEEAQLQEFDVPELSPDGRHIAYTAMKEGRRQLFVNDLRAQHTVALPGTDGATFPFWAPDAKTLAFFAANSLKRVALAGGAADVLAETAHGMGGTWTPGTILFAPIWQGGLHRLADTGGTPTPLKAMATSPREQYFITPNFLPDGVHFTSTGLGSRGVYFGSLDEPAAVRRLVAVDTWWARFASGHLLYLQGRALMARPFDVKQREFSGPEFKVAEPAGPFSAVGNGTVVYREPPPLPRLTWLARDGVPHALPTAPADFIGISMAPSGRRAAVWKRDDGGNVDLWEVDLSGGALTRLTTDPAPDSDVVWSPDERRVAFTSARLGRSAVFVKDLTSGAETMMHAPPEHVVLDGWTPDGLHLIVRVVSGPGFLVAVKGDQVARKFIDTPYSEDEHQVSRDGKWIAYNSNESGSFEVYIATFPDFAEKRQVSRGGGVQPHWRGDGKELFFLSPAGAMMGVTLGQSKGIEAGAPRRLFATNIEPSPSLAQYAVKPDGRQFLVLDRGERRPDSFHVLVNWLRAAAPSAP